MNIIIILLLQLLKKIVFYNKNENKNKKFYSDLEKFKKCF